MLPRPLASVATLAWMASIFWLSSDRRDLLPPGLFGRFTGNAAHAPLFGVLALLAARGTGSPRLGIAIALLYAVADESHQAFVPGRSSSPFDLATDAVGAIAALWLIGTGGEPLAATVAERRVIGSAGAIALSAGLATLFG